MTPWSTRLHAAADLFQWDGGPDKRLSIVDPEQPAVDLGLDELLGAFLRAEAANASAIESLPEVDGDHDVRDALGETLIALVEAIEAETR